MKIIVVFSLLLSFATLVLLLIFDINLADKNQLDINYVISTYCLPFLVIWLVWFVILYGAYRIRTSKNQI